MNIAIEINKNKKHRTSFLPKESLEANSISYQKKEKEKIE